MTTPALRVPCPECGGMMAHTSKLCMTCYRKKAHQAAEQEEVLPKCECVHHNDLTCQAKLEHTTRFNALICFGACQCYCHHDRQGQPVTQEAWDHRYEKRKRRKMVSV